MSLGGHCYEQCVVLGRPKRFTVTCELIFGHEGEHWAMGRKRSVYWDNRYFNIKANEVQVHE